MKRFTETDKWSDPWFRRLSGPAKLLWQYATDRCDKIGLIEIDTHLATTDCGLKITENHIAEFGDRIQCLGNDRYFLTKFINFQYGELSETCPPHKTILKLIAVHGLTKNGLLYSYPNATIALLLKNGKEEERKDGGVGEGVTAEQIYAAYPRKVGRPVALRAIRAAMLKTDPKTLLATTVAYAQRRNGDVAFVPHPSTWFNQERYNDDPSTWINNENGKTNNPQRVDRGAGTLNAGRSSEYAGLGKVDGVQH